MAGFFGFFNYEKEGPGIKKDTPKKKSFIVFFETFFRNFWKFIPLNFVYSLLSLPILTNGFACAGITNVTRNIARDKHSFGLSDFFETIKKNWKQAISVGIVNTIIYMLLIFDVYFFYTSVEGIMSSIGIGIMLCLLFIFTNMNYFIWTLMITFKFSLKQIYRNSFKFVFINLKRNLICFFTILLVYAINIAIAYFLLSYIVIVLTFEILIYILIFPAFRFLLVQFCTFPSIKKYIIDPYYLAHPDEDIEKRKNLGIEIEGQDKEQSDKAFSDTEIENVNQD